MEKTVSAVSPDRRVSRSVAIDQLPAEMQRLWTDLSAHVEQEFGQVPAHTDILTLIAVAQGRIEERIARETLAQMSNAQPSRAIGIFLGPAGTETTADVAASCRVAPDGRVNCYEIIDVRLAAERITSLPSIIDPLELFDVPTYIWWVGEVDLDSPGFQRVALLADRVLIDTSRFADGPQALRDFHAFLTREANGCFAGDITWARATSWRELIAQSFDNPLARDVLWGLQHVEIDFDPAAESQALLLAGWFGAQLGWVPGSANWDGATLRANASSIQGTPITLALNRQPGAGSGLRSVRMLGRGERGMARISVRRRSSELAGVLFETAGMRQERVVPDNERRIPDLVGTELLSRTKDRIYQQALECAIGWLHMNEGSS